MSVPEQLLTDGPPAHFAVSYNGVGKPVNTWRCEPGAEASAIGANIIVEDDPRGDDPSLVLVEDADGSIRPQNAAEKLAMALARAQKDKGVEIETAFEKGSRRDVVVDGVVYGGGMTSALLIDGTTRKNRGRGKGAAKVWPKGNRQGLQLTVEQAENVSFEITAAVERDYETLQTLLNTVETATTVEAVEAIDIPPEWL